MSFRVLRASIWSYIERLLAPCGLILELLGDPRRSLGTLLELVGDLSELLQLMVEEISS